MINESNPKPLPTVTELEESHVLDDQTPEYILAHREEFLHILENAEPTIVGDIIEFRPELAGHHSNKVLMAEIPYDVNSLPEATGSSKVKFFEIFYQEKPIVAIFKPASGESSARLEDFQIRQMYTREKAAYVIDYFMELGIVPPTVIKDIDGEVGSLQLYIPHTTAKSPNVSRELSEKQDFTGLEWKKMAMLDRLINNRDRNNGNYLVCFNDPSRFFAVDHGCSFCQARRGDSNLAYDYFLKHSGAAELDDDLRASLQKLIDNEQKVLEALPPDISGYVGHEKQTTGLTMFDRARQMLERDSILLEEDLQ